MCEGSTLSDSTDKHELPLSYQILLPVAVDNRAKCVAASRHHEGYRAMSLSSRSAEEMRRRCMVRVTFTRWLLPQTQPSESVNATKWSRKLNTKDKQKRTEQVSANVHTLSFASGFMRLGGRLVSLPRRFLSPRAYLTSALCGQTTFPYRACPLQLNKWHLRSQREGETSDASTRSRAEPEADSPERT